MGLYNLSDFITTIKEDIGIKDLPLPVSDQELIDRFDRSVLTDFSLINPRVETCMISDDDLTEKAKESIHTFYEYKIPKWVYDGTVILSVSNFDVVRPNGYSDFFIPNANWSTPDAVIAAMADVRMAAGVASNLAKAPTWQFKKPNIIQVYNGWAGGIYEVELLVKHDLSLSTIEDGSFMDLRELAALDMKMYLYNLLKRKDSLEVGVGSIQLKIDDWSNAEQDKKELLRTWREDGANLDFDHVRYY